MTIPGPGARLDEIKDRLDRGMIPTEGEARWLVGEVEAYRELAGLLATAALDFAGVVSGVTEPRHGRPSWRSTAELERAARDLEGWDERTGIYFEPE